MTRRNAFWQMEHDGISTLPRHLRGGICVKVLNPGDRIVIRCHKHQRYQTPKGRMCYEHAIEQATQ